MRWSYSEESCVPEQEQTYSVKPTKHSNAGKLQLGIWIRVPEDRIHTQQQNTHQTVCRPLKHSTRCQESCWDTQQ